MKFSRLSLNQIQKKKKKIGWQMEVIWVVGDVQNVGHITELVSNDWKASLPPPQNTQSTVL